MNPMRQFVCAILMLVCLELAAAPVPVVYSTDLFHPHDDPDDHFDLATLFALPDLEVKALLLDQGEKQLKRPGAIPVRQMFRLAGRAAPMAIGLAQKLSSPADDGRKQPEQFQGAVELLLKCLRDSTQPVTIITAGSVRDVCAAWNREPEMLRKKVERLYVNIGSAEDGGIEYNVGLDPAAYCGLLRSGLPIYLCFCLPMERGPGSNQLYSTWWRFRQSEVLESAPKPLQNFFIYALQRAAPEEFDPAQALEMDLRPWRRLVWDMERNMWCTAPFLHAAGKSIYKREGRWSLKPPSAPGAEAEAIFKFIPARLEVDETGRTKKMLNDPHPNVQLFHITDPSAYGPAMKDCLRELFREFPAPR